MHVIWYSRNLIKFQNIHLSAIRGIYYCKSLLHNLSSSCPRNVAHYHDLLVFLRLGINARLARAPRILEVVWQRPLYSWIKVNTDGSSKNNPVLSACGGSFRDHNGGFLGGFSAPLVCQSSFYA